MAIFPCYIWVPEANVTPTVFRSAAGCRCGGVTHVGTGSPTRGGDVAPMNTHVISLDTSHEVSVQGLPNCRMSDEGFRFGGIPCAVRALCEKLAVLHHREFGKFRRLKGRH